MTWWFFIRHEGLNSHLELTSSYYMWRLNSTKNKGIEINYPTKLSKNLYIINSKYNTWDKYKPKGLETCIMICKYSLHYIEIESKLQIRSIWFFTLPIFNRASLDHPFVISKTLGSIMKTSLQTLQQRKLLYQLISLLY